jgi:hypothetical protein
MVNAWMQTVKQVRDQMPKGTPLKAILKAAKKVYRKPAGLVKKVAKRVKRAVTGKRRKRRGTKKKRKKSRKGKKRKGTKKRRRKR